MSHECDNNATQEFGSLMGACARFVGLSLISSVFFLTSYIILRFLSPEEIIFTQGIYTCLGVFVFEIATITLFAKFILRRSVDAFIATVFPSLLMSLCMNYAFILTVPTTIDRSITVFLLGNIDHYGNLSTQDLVNNFQDKYISKDFQINRRINEQIELGDITHAKSNIENLELTKKGKFFVKLHKFFGEILNISPYYATGGKEGKP